MQLPVSTVETVKNEMEGSFPDIICHATKGSSTIFQLSYVYFGHLRKELFQYGRFMAEAGIMSLILEYPKYISNLVWNRKIQSRIREEMKSGEYAFEISDWKIISIFVVWSCLLGVAFIVFLIETQYKRHERRRRRCVGMSGSNTAELQIKQINRK